MHGGLDLLETRPYETRRTGVLFAHLLDDLACRAITIQGLGFKV